MNILVLCTGNSCRSQMAAAFLKSFNKELAVFSAGTVPAISVNAGAIKYMKEIGIDISHEIPKSITQFLDKEWDYVITVCGEANEDCPYFTGKVKSRLHIGFDDPSKATGNADFIEKEFRRVRNEIKKRFFDFYTQKIKETTAI